MLCSTKNKHYWGHILGKQLALVETLTENASLTVLAQKAVVLGQNGGDVVGIKTKCLSQLS